MIFVLVLAITIGAVLGAVYIHLATERGQIDLGDATRGVLSPRDANSGLGELNRTWASNAQGSSTDAGGLVNGAGNIR